MADAHRLLVKLRPTATVAAANPRANLWSLHGAPPAEGALGLAAPPTWDIADLRDGALP